MIIARNDEVKRSRIWKIVTLTTSALIILIAIYLLTKMFTSNPLEGKWASEDGDIVMDVAGGSSLTITVTDIAEGEDVDIEMSYTLDKEEKIITIREDSAELDKLAEKSGGAYTRETLESAVSAISTTFDYSVDQEMLTLTEREYGEQLTFVRQ